MIQQTPELLADWAAYERRNRRAMDAYGQRAGAIRWQERTCRRNNCGRVMPNESDRKAHELLHDLAVVA